MTSLKVVLPPELVGAVDRVDGVEVEPWDGTGEAPQGWRASPTKTSVRLDPTPSAPSWPADNQRRSMKTIDF